MTHDARRTHPSPCGRDVSLSCAFILRDNFSVLYIPAKINASFIVDCMYPVRSIVFVAEYALPLVTATCDLVHRCYCCKLCCSVLPIFFIIVLP